MHPRQSSTPLGVDRESIALTAYRRISVPYTGTMKPLAKQHAAAIGQVLLTDAVPRHLRRFMVDGVVDNRRMPEGSLIAEPASQQR